MWQSKGRSGYGDTNLDGTYDDVILGVSPNGRQYRNESTLEQRDLSGWAYWNLRKQITPEQEIPEGLFARNETEAMSHTLANGQANLLKYADPVPTKRKTSIPLADRILPQAKRLRTIQEQLIELEKEFKAGMDIETYSRLRDVLIVKRDKAEILYKRVISIKPRSQLEDDTEILDDSPLSCEEYAQENVVKVGGDDVDRGEDFAWLRDQNSLKKILQRGCKVVRKAVQFSQATRNYIKTLSEV